MCPTRDDSMLPQRLQAGHSTAASSINRRYRQQLIALVYREMGDRLARREDPEDIVQSAMCTFFRGIQERQFHVDSSGALWKLLETITRHKILKHIERNRADKRNPSREQTMNSQMFFPAADPSPAEAAHLIDVMEQALKGLDAPYAEIFFMRLEGFTLEEIAQKFNCTRAVIRTKLGRIRQRMEGLLSEESMP